MARRRRSQCPSPVVSVLIVAAVLGLGYLGFQRFATGGPDEFRGLTHLDVADYLENSLSLQGNVYKVEGRVEDQLGWSPSGRVLMVVSQGNPIGLKVPDTFNDQNIQAGQSFAFKVRVGQNGVLTVEALTKA